MPLGINMRRMFVAASRTNNSCSPLLQYPSSTMSTPEHNEYAEHSEHHVFLEESGGYCHSAILLTAKQTTQNPSCLFDVK